jgi:hypothetical protein
MKTPIITLACTALASFAFLACEDTGTNPAPTPPNVGCKIVAVSPPISPPKISTAEGVFINPEVEEWVEDQISSGKNDRTAVSVYDFQKPTYKTPEPELACSGSYNTSTGEIEEGCILNDVSMTREEYDEYMEKWRIENPPIYRELVIPGEITDAGEASRYWIVSMTASEIIELAQKYTALFIEFYTEAKHVNGVPAEPGSGYPGSGYNNDAPPPPIAGPAEDTGGPRCP